MKLAHTLASRDALVNIALHPGPHKEIPALDPKNRFFPIIWTALALCLLPPRRFFRNYGRALMLPLIVVLAISAMRELPYQTQPITDDDVTTRRMWTEEREAGQIGSTWTGEYVPTWVKEQRWAIGRSWRDAGTVPAPGMAPHSSSG